VAFIHGEVMRWRTPPPHRGVLVLTRLSGVFRSKAAVDYEDDETESSTAATATCEPISSAAAKVAYKVLVCNAEKHGTGVSAYLTYEVRTKMMGGAFGERDLSVRRRYADFVWLRSTLACNYLHALIPVLSDKEKLLSGRSHTAKHEARVMDARCRQLQSFMGQVCTHPSLSQSKDLLAFLEAKVFAIDASASLVPNINTASQLIWSLGRDAQRAGSLLLGQYSDGKPDPEHERNQAMQTFCGKFEEQGGLLLESFKKMSKRNQGIGQDLSEMSPVFEALGRAETHDPLAQALQRCASAAAEMSETYSEQASIDELATIEPIRDLVLLSTAAKDVLNNRDEAMVSILEIREAKARIARDLHKAQQDLDPSGPPKAKSAFALFKETMTLDKPEDVVKKLEAQKAECEAAATRAEKR
ncbi:MAG: hypothetical protein ACPIOQ_01520, partial [Promethearchaeia archaeon]